MKCLRADSLKAAFRAAVFFLCFCFWFASPSQTICTLSKESRAWFGRLQLNDSIDLDFNFRLSSEEQKPKVIIYNADEIISSGEVVPANDSIGLKMPVFDTELRFVFINKDSISGFWVNHSGKAKRELKFSGGQRSIQPYPDALNSKFTGKWEVDFNPGSVHDVYKAIGLFRNSDCLGRIYGTFCTETGDYRFLSGRSYEKNKDTIMKLSCFDGAHAYVFTCKLLSGKLVDGHFYAGAHGHEFWAGKRNDRFELRNEDSITFLKPGFDRLDFNFPNLDNQQVSLADEKYKGKVVILQIMGSWCPNCMDETKFFSGFYKLNRGKGLEVIALAYERTGDLEKAKANVQRLKKRFDCEYDFLIAGTTSDKAEAAKTLPALKELNCFPTTVYVDKNGKVRKISSGFNGPATGEYYEKFVAETNAFVEKLLRE